VRKHSKIDIKLKSKIDFITEKADVLKSSNGMIELDPKNPEHVEWFEDDNEI